MGSGSTGSGYGPGALGWLLVDVGPDLDELDEEAVAHGREARHGELELLARAPLPAHPRPQHTTLAFAHDGLLQDLGMTVNGSRPIEPLYRAAVQRIRYKWSQPADAGTPPDTPRD